MLIAVIGFWPTVLILAVLVLAILAALCTWEFWTAEPFPDPEPPPEYAKPTPAPTPRVVNKPSGDPILDEWARLANRQIDDQGNVVPLPKKYTITADDEPGETPPGPFTLPTDEGRKRYPAKGIYEAGYYHGDPCTCTTGCPADCPGAFNDDEPGACQCAACGAWQLDLAAMDL